VPIKPICYRVLWESLFVTGLLLGVSVFCTAEEPVASRTLYPADPREVFQRSGINSFDKGALSNIVLRGYQRENLMITFDGAPYFGAAPYRTDAPPVIVNSSDIGSIVVTKGPYNLAYPGGAGGSIEVLSPDNPRRFAARGSVSYGAYDAVNGTATLGIGNQVADFSAGYRGIISGVPDAGGGVPLVRTPFPNANNNYRSGVEDQDMYRLNSFWLRGGVNPAVDTRVELSYTFLQGSDIKFPTQNFDVTDEQVHRLNGRLTLRNLSAIFRELRLQGWWSQSQTSVDDSLRETSDPANTALPYRSFLSRGYAMSSQLETTTTGGRISSQLALGPGLLKNGVDLYQRVWSGNYSSLLKQGATTWKYYDSEILIPDVTTCNLGIFLIYEIPLSETVRAVVSTRGDYSQIDADGLTADRINSLYQPYYPGQMLPTNRDFADWSANIQLFWKPQPQLELFLKGGRAIRLPDASELYMGQIRTGSNLVSNPFLNQTVVNQVDIGTVWSAAGYRAELTFFYGETTDFILPVKRLSSSLIQARSTANIDATIWGIEFDGQVRLTNDLKLSAMLSYSEGDNRSSGRPLAEIPPLRGRLGLSYDNQHFFASISEVLVARQNRFDSTLNETSMPGYSVTNMQLGGRYKDFTLTATINNLFDNYYVMPLYYQRDPISMGSRIPETGRSFTLTANYRF